MTVVSPGLWILLYLLLFSNMGILLLATMVEPALLFSQKTKSKSVWSFLATHRNEESYKSAHFSINPTYNPILMTW